MKQPCENFLDIMCTPDTHDPLELRGDTLYAKNNTYPIVDGIPLFLTTDISLESQRQQAHYQKVSADYIENLTYVHTKVYNEYLDGALHQATQNTDMDCVAEICCGNGESFAFYATHMSRGIGVDISSSMLKSANARGYGEHILFVCGDALQLPVKDASCSTVFMLGGIHHIPDKQRLYAELYRILKPGGRLIAREPCDDFALWRFLRKMIYALSPALDAETERPLRYHEDTALLAQAGFSMESWKTYGFLGYCFFMNSDVLRINKVFRFFPYIDRIVRKAIRFDEWSLHFEKAKHWGAQVVFSARK